MSLELHCSVCEGNLITRSTALNICRWKRTRNSAEETNSSMQTHLILTHIKTEHSGLLEEKARF